MKLAMIGLGKMGGNMAERLRRHGHEVVGMDPGKPEADAHSLDELAAQLSDGLKQVRASTGSGSVCAVVEVAPWSRIPEARALFVPRDE